MVVEEDVEVLEVVDGGLVVDVDGVVVDVIVDVVVGVVVDVVLTVVDVEDVVTVVVVVACGTSGRLMSALGLCAGLSLNSGQCAGTMPTREFTISNIMSLCRIHEAPRVVSAPAPSSSNA